MTLIVTLHTVLSRLLVVLALVLAGGAQSHAHLTVVHSAPAVQAHDEDIHGILIAQEHLPRVQPPGENLTDVVLPGFTDRTRQPVIAVSAPLAQQPFFTSKALHILPPVRGPPAV